MSWIKGTSTDYKDLLRQLVAISTGSSVATAAILAGGAGYTVGDILTGVGGTFSYAPTFRVTTIGGGGAITGLVLATAGAYTATPSSPLATTGGTGTGATVTVTFATNGWTTQRLTQQAASATVAAGGTGYTVGNVLTVVGGNFNVVATFTVATAPGGVVATVTLLAVGEYRDPPTNPAATTGGSGTGCTLNVTFTPYAGTSEIETILLGTGSGSDSIYVGAKTYQIVNGLDTGFNWTLNGMTAFNKNLAFDAQPGSLTTGPVPTAAGGAYVPLKPANAFNMTFWLSVTPRRIKMWATVETATTKFYVSCYLGFQNPFGTTTEFPYPIIIAGSTARHDCIYFTTAPSITGLTEVVGIIGRTGPVWYRRSDSTWQDVKNSTAADTGSPTRGASNTFTMYPCGRTSLTGVVAADFVVNDNAVLDWSIIIPPTGIPGTATLKLMPTPNTVGALHFLVPATICASNSGPPLIFDVLGELDEVYWISASGGIASEDTFTIGTDTYRIFQNGNRTTEFSFLATKEA